MVLPDVGLTVGVVGAGYVGLATALSLAWTGRTVRVLDRDEARIARLRRSEDPLGEPHVSELLGSSLPITFTADPAEAFDGVGWILVAVGTPTTVAGHADLSQLESAAAAISRYSQPCRVAIRSTVPVGTADRLASTTLRAFRVVANPEFLREGMAIEDSLRPNRIVAGGGPEDRSAMRELYAPILEQQVASLGGLSFGPDPCPFYWMDRRSAELAKYASNAFLVTKLSFVNEIANVAASLGADIRAITEVLGSDPRIGPSFLRPGIGWGGSCFPKDARALDAVAAESGYQFLILRAAIEQNNAQLQRAMRELRAELAGRPGIRIGLFGLAFKAGTSDHRDSPAVALAREMVAEGWLVRAYDPAVSSMQLTGAGLTIVGSPLDAARDADAIVIATEWPEFARADLASLRAAMKGDLLFDGRCIIDPAAAESAGLRYRGICPPATAD